MAEHSTKPTILEVLAQAGGVLPDFVNPQVQLVRAGRSSFTGGISALAWPGTRFLGWAISAT